MWVRRLPGQGLRQEGSWNDSCSPVKAEILTGLCEIHCCCPWRAPKALPSPRRGKTLGQQLGDGEQFLKGYIATGLSEWTSFYPPSSSATLLLQHFVFLSPRKPFCLIAVFPNSGVVVHRHTQLCMCDLMFPKGWFFPSAAILNVNIHKSERNLAHRKS